MVNVRNIDTAPLSLLMSSVPTIWGHITVTAYCQRLVYSNFSIAFPWTLSFVSKIQLMACYAHKYR
jgi:hypothetical protein